MIVKQSTTDLNRYDFYTTIIMKDVNDADVEIPKLVFSYTLAQLNTLKLKYLTEVTVLNEKISDIDAKLLLIDNLE